MAAEIVVEESIVVQAPPGKVWRVFRDVESWPAWNPVVMSARHLSGHGWEIGSTFHLELRPGRFATTFQPSIIEANPGRRVTWVGEGMGVVGRHTFTFEQQGANTVVTSREAFSGPFLWLMRLIFPPSAIKGMLGRWLAALKDQVETPEGRRTA